MKDYNLYSKINLLTTHNDKSENFFSLDINDSFHSSAIDDKYISTEKNDIFDKEHDFNFPEKFEENNEKDFNNSDNNNNIYNQEFAKKQLKLKRKRELAKQGRLRKKIYIENLIEEINHLKNKNSILLTIILKCQKCKDEYNKEIEKSNQSKSQYILSTNESSVSKKSKLLFMTAITLISIFNIFSLFSYENKPKEIIKKMNLSISEQKDIFINKIKSQNEEEALFLHLAEFYSLTSREKVNDIYEMDKEINKNLKIFKNETFNTEKMNQTNMDDCVRCVVEIDKNSIKTGGDEFTFYLTDKLLAKNFMNNLEDGTLPEIEFDKEKLKSETFSKVFALRCKIIAYSINNIYTKKIEQIS